MTRINPTPPTSAARRRLALRLPLLAMLPPLLGGGATAWGRTAKPARPDKAAAAAAATPAALPTGPLEYLYEGALGTEVIGMTLVPPRTGDGVMTGHYFFGKALVDVALAGTLQGGRMVLNEAGGGLFDLELVGTGSGDGGKPLLPGNAIGATGTWTQGRKRLDVTLGKTASREPGARRYEQVTTEPDAAFEARVQGFQKAVLAGNRAEAVLFVNFPLKVGPAGGKARQIASSDQLVATWDQVFTRACIEALKVALPHDMQVSNGQAMMGGGLAWFGANGATAIVPP